MLIACLACGKRISDRAPACPFCGTKAAGPAVSQLPAEDATAPSSLAAPSPTAVAPTPRFERGDFIGGELQVLEVLGEGGFGTVYLAASQETGELVAVKALRSELLRDARVVEMFRKEARIWTELGRHPFLVKAAWVNEIAGRLYLAMEYVRGRPGQPNSMEGVLRKGVPPTETAVLWAIEFCHGMEHAVSRGIRCHRDIKPANVLIAEDGRVRISDFGIAGLALHPDAAGTHGVGVPPPSGEDPDRTAVGTVFGTPTHMSPEQFEDAASCDERSDVYSFGVVLHQLATGRLPFHPGPPPAGADPAAHYWLSFRRLHREAEAAAVDSPLAPLIARCLCKAPSERYPSFRELRADLEALHEKLTGKRAPGLGSAEESVADLVNRGLSLSSLDRHAEALECYDRALVLAPDEKALHNNKGNALRRLGRRSEALASLERALALDPSFDDAWYNEGLLFTEAGRFGEALHAFEQALASNVRSVPAWIGKGHVLGRLGRATEERQCLDRALEIDPRDPIAWFNKGHLFSGSDAAQAIACYDHALEANPRYAEAWCAKAVVLAEAGRPAEALACFDEGLRIDPQSPQLHYNKGNVLAATGHFAEAQACFDAATRQPGCQPVAWYNRGLAEHQLERSDAALASLREFVKRTSVADPLLPGAQALVRKLEAGDHAALRPKAADRRIEATYETVAIGEAPPAAKPDPSPRPSPAGRPAAPAARAPAQPPMASGTNAAAPAAAAPRRPRPPGTAESWNERAAALHRDRRFAEAAEAAENALRLDPGNATALNNLATCLFGAGRGDEALGRLERVLLTRPDHLDAWFNKAVIESRLGREPAALRSLLEVLEIVGDGRAPQVAKRAQAARADLERQGVKASPRNHLGWLAVGLRAVVAGRPDDALLAFDRAIDARPDVPELREWKGAALREQDRLDESLACFDSALQAAPRAAVLHHGRGMTLVKLRRFEEAVAAFEQALAVDPEHAASWSDRGKTLGVLKRNEEAIESFVRAAALAPENPAPWQNQALLAEEMGRPDEALRLYREFLRWAKPDMRLQVEHAKARVQVLEARLGAAPPPAPESPIDVLRKDPALRSSIPFADVGSAEMAKIAALMDSGQEDEAFDRLAQAEARAEAARGGPTAGEEAQSKAALDALMAMIDERAAHQMAAEAGARPASPPAAAGKPVRPGNPVARKFAERAAEEIRAGQHAKALESLDQAIARDPTVAVFFANRGLALFHLGRAAEARDSYEKALALDAQCAPALLNLSGMLNEARRFTEALELAGRAVGAATASGLAWSNLGSILLNLQSWSKAAQAFLVAVKLDPRDGRSWVGLGQAAQRDGEHAAALQALEKGLALDPAIPEGWYQKGNALLDLGRTADAVESYRKCVELEPTRANAWYNLGFALNELGRHAEAIPPCEKAIALHPAFDRAWVSIGDAKSALGRPQEALAAYDEALAIASDYEPAIVGKGAALRKLGRRSDALACCDVVLGRRPRDPGALRARAELLDELGRPEEAAAAYDAFLAVGNLAPLDAKPIRDRLAVLRPSSSGSGTAAPGDEPIPEAVVPNVLPTRPPPDCQKRGEMALAQGQPERAVEWFDQWITAEPRSYNAWAGKAEALFALRRYVECVAQVNKALEINPRFVQGWQRKAQALHAAGRHEDSLAAWENGLALAATNIHLLNGRGLALLALGRDADALSSFDQALGVDPRFSLARYEKARAEERLGRIADAARSYQQFLALAPAHLVAQIQDARQKIQELKPV